MSEIIDRVVEFCLTHAEHYSIEQTSGAVKLNPNDHYWLTVKQIGSTELLANSAAHRQKIIAAWQKFARDALLK